MPTVTPPPPGAAIVLPERFIDLCHYAGELSGWLAPTLAALMTVGLVGLSIWRSVVLRRSGKPRRLLWSVSAVSMTISVVLTLALAVNSWVGYVPSFAALGRWLDGRAQSVSHSGAIGSGDRVETTDTQSTTFQVTIPAAAAGVPDATAWVYLPRGYDQSVATRYPVVIALHGDPGKGADWFVAGAIQETLDGLIEAGALPPVVLVAPDLSAGLGADYREPVNLPDGPAIMDFVAHDVVDWTDHSLRTLGGPEERVIAGFSSGGFGSLVIGLHNPAVFGGIVSIIPYTVPYTEAYQDDPALRAEWDPSEYIAHARDIRPTFLGMAGLETPENGNRLAAALTARNAVFTKRVFEQQPHTWQTARIIMPYGLVWMANQLGWAAPLSTPMAHFPLECKPTPN